VVPVIGALALIPGFFSVAGITGVPGLSFISALTSPFLMAGWVVIGIVVLLILRARKPEAIAAVAQIHLEEEGV
jgi:hypothetical protein